MATATKAAVKAHTNTTVSGADVSGTRGTAVVTPEPMGNTGELVAMAKSGVSAQGAVTGIGAVLLRGWGGTGMSLSPALS